MEILGFNPKDHIFAVSDALASAAGVPVMFLHGEKDTTSSAPALVAGASEPRKITIVSGADHHFAGQEELLRNALIEGLDWIRSQKRPAPSPDPNHP
jgi:alpha/beta superfamily hydrolase